MLQTRARDNVCYVAFVNAVGAQDELVFDGHSVVLDDEGEVLARAPGFEEALLVVDIEPAGGGRSAAARRAPAVARERAGGGPGRCRSSTSALRDRLGSGCRGTVAPLLDELEQMRLALELGLRDYVDKNGFRRRRHQRLRRDRLGVDRGDRLRGARARARALRVDAVAVQLGGDARRRAAARRALGADFLELPIEPIVESFLETLRRVVRRAASRTSPRRTSRRASAACC